MSEQTFARGLGGGELGIPILGSSSETPVASCTLECENLDTLGINLIRQCRQSTSTPHPHFSPPRCAANDCWRRCEMSALGLCVTCHLTQVFFVPSAVIIIIAIMASCFLRRCFCSHCTQGWKADLSFPFLVLGRRRLQPSVGLCLSPLL